MDSLNNRTSAGSDLEENVDFLRIKMGTLGNKYLSLETQKLKRRRAAGYYDFDFVHRAHEEIIKLLDRKLEIINHETTPTHCRGGRQC